MTPVISTHAKISVGSSACCDLECSGPSWIHVGLVGRMTHLLAVPGTSPRLMIGIFVPFLLWNVSFRHRRNPPSGGEWVRNVLKHERRYNPSPLRTLIYVSDDVWQVFRGDRWGRGDKEQAQTPERGLHWSLSMNISAPFFFSTLLPSNPSAATCRWATRLTSLSHTCRVRGTSGYRYLRMLRCRSGSATLRTVMLNLPCHLGEIWSADRATVYPHYTKHLTGPV